MAKAATRKASRRDMRPPPAYKRAGPDVELGLERFRFVLRRAARKLPTVILDDLVDNFDCQRDGSVRTGELNYHRPPGPDGASLVAQGDTVDVYVGRLGSSRWRLKWRLTAGTPNHQVRDGLISVPLRSALKNATKQRASWKVPRGRRAHTAARQAADRFGVPVGALARGTHPLPKHVAKSESVIDVVAWGYKHERDATGRRFDIDLSRGRLDVIEVKDSPNLLVLGPTILDATLERSLARMATALVVTSSHKPKGSRTTRKVRVKVVDRAREKRYGYIERHVNEPGLKTVAEARRWAKRELAERAQPKGEVTFTHPGMIDLERGQACDLVLPEDGLHSICWVKSVRHAVSAGSYEVEVTVSFTDPYRDARRERVRKLREAAERRRKGAHGRASAPPKTRKADRRAAA